VLHLFFKCANENVTVTRVVVKLCYFGKNMFIFNEYIKIYTFCNSIEFFGCNSIKRCILVKCQQRIYERIGTI